MRRRAATRGEQLSLAWSEDAAAERAANQALAEHIEANGFRWRLQMTITHTLLMIMLVLAAGLMSGRAWLATVRTAAVMGGSCLAAGMILMMLSSTLAAASRRLLKSRPK